MTVRQFAIISSIDETTTISYILIIGTKETPVKLSAAQFGVLDGLARFGPANAVEVTLPPSIDGKRKTRLEWNMATGPTLEKLVAAGLVHVARNPMPIVRNAVGKKGHHRTALTITITDDGRRALND